MFCNSEYLPYIDCMSSFKAIISGLTYLAVGVDSRLTELHYHRSASGPSRLVVQDSVEQRVHDADEGILESNHSKPRNYYYPIAAVANNAGVVVARDAQSQWHGRVDTDPTLLILHFFQQHISVMSMYDAR